MAYVLVEFTESDGGNVAIVHSEWITPRKTEVYWPPYKSQSQFNKALRKGEQVDTEKWKLFGISRCFYTCDDYEKINDKLKECEVTSDIQSDTNDTNKRARKRIPNRKYVSSDDESDHDSGLVRPPRMPSPLRTVEKRIQCTSAAPSSSISYNLFHENVHDNDNYQINTENIEKLIHLQQKNIELLMHIKEQNNQILATIAKQERVTSSPLPDLPVQLQVNTFEDLKTLDEFLKENLPTADILGSYLSTLGGRDLTNKTNRVLKYLLSDEVAKKFNFYGKRSDKEAFSNLTLSSIIVRAIKVSHPTASIKEVEDGIKVWLKHAPERLKRLNKHATQT